MNKFYFPLLITIFLLAACKGEYNPTFRKAYDKANRIFASCHTTWKMIEYDGASLETVFEICEMSEEKKEFNTKLLLDSMKFYVDKLAEIKKEDESFQDISELYEKCAKAVKYLHERNVVEFQSAELDLKFFIADFKERNKSRLE